ncbi:MAG: hypothetical protein ACK40O_10640 [Allosphingosinicella sp.]
MDLAGPEWGILTIVGPILIVIVVIWAILRNRKANTPGSVNRTEAATHELYDEEEIERRHEDEHRR